MSEQVNTSRATAVRISYLSDRATLDSLLDEFQDMGIPMGSSRWAEYCLERLRELREKEKTLNVIMYLHDDMAAARNRCRSRTHLECRRKMTEEYQQQQREKERAESSTI